MTELRAAYRLDLVGNLFRQARRVSGEMERMSGRSENALTRMQRRAAAVEGGIGMLARQAGMLAGGFVGVQEIRRLMSLEERLERLGVNAGRSTVEMQAFRDAVNATAAAPDIRVDPAQIIAAVEAITAATGDFDMASAMQREIGLALQATGAGGAEIGALMASIAQKFNLTTPEGMLAALDLLAKQGKAGAIELANLADLGPKVFSAYASLGKGGLEGLAEAGALMQIFKKGVGSADQAATVFENVFNALGRKDVLDKLTARGVEINDAAGNLKQPVELLEEIITRAGGNDRKLGDGAFDAETLRGLRQLSEMFREMDGFTDLRTLIDIEADGSTIKEDSARLAATASAAATSALAGVRDASEDALMQFLPELAEVLRSVDSETVKTWAGIATAIGGIAVAAKGAMLVRDVASGLRGLGGVMLPGGLDAAGGAGSVLTSGVQQVFVTNWPDTIGSGGGGGGGVSDILGDMAGVVRGRALVGLLGGLYVADRLSEMDRDIEARADALEAAGMSRDAAEATATTEAQAQNLASVAATPGLRELSRFSIEMKHFFGRRANEEDYRLFPDLAAEAPPERPVFTAPEPSPFAPRSRLSEYGGGASVYRLPEPSPLEFGPPAPPALYGPPPPPPAPSDPELLDAVRDVVDETRAVADRVGGLERAIRARALHRATPGSTGLLEVHP